MAAKLKEGPHFISIYFNHISIVFLLYFHLISKFSNI